MTPLAKQVFGYHDRMEIMRTMRRNIVPGDPFGFSRDRWPVRCVGPIPGPEWNGTSRECETLILGVPSKNKILCVCGKSYHPKQAWIHAKCVANSRSEQVKPKADAAGCGLLRVNGADAASRPTESQRVKAWREKNRDRYNERERERMRLKRSGFIGIPYG